MMGGESDVLFVVINGERRRVRAHVLAELIAELGLGSDERGIAVAINGSVVPRSAWQSRALAGGDEVEVVGAVQGG